MQPSKPKKSSSWSAKEEQQLIDLRNGKGWLWTSIGTHLSKNPDICRTHYAELMHQRLLGKMKPTKTRVKCLGPITPAHYFISDDKTRFRICPSCKVFAAGLPDIAADVISDVLIPEVEWEDEDELEIEEKVTPHIVRPITFHKFRNKK